MVVLWLLWLEDMGETIAGLVLVELSMQKPDWSGLEGWLIGGKGKLGVCSRSLDVTGQEVGGEVTGGYYGGVHGRIFRERGAEQHSSGR